MLQDQLYSREELEAQLARIGASNAFARAERMSRFLRFVVEQSFDGTRNDLKEYAVGLAVFDRPASFDPQTDSVVRGGARRLRAMLLDYYAGPGRLDPIRIELPKGTYVPVFSPGPAAAAEGAAALETEPVRSPDGKSALRHGRNLLLLATAGLMAAVAAWVLLARQPVPGRTLTSIAVFPFRDLSPAQDQEALCEGLAEQLMHGLAAVSGLRVVGPDSTIRQRVDESGAQRLGKQLNVDAVLHGSVQRVGKRIRVWVRLMAVSDGSQILSTSYDREFAHVFDIQEHVGRTVIAALGARRDPAQSVWVSESRRRNVDAWNLYLLGQFYHRRFTPPDADKAQSYFEKALELDPDYAPAYSGLSEVFLFQAGDPARQAKSLEKMATFARKALELDPALPEPQEVLAMERVFRWDWAAAEREFLTAQRMNPHSGSADIRYALYFLMVQGRSSEALAEAREALRADPLSPRFYREYGWMLYLARDYDAALKALLTARDFDNGMFTHLHVGKVHVQKKRFQGAERECRWPVRPDPVCIAIALAGQGKRAEAEAVIRDVQTDTGRRHSRGERIAEYYAFTGQREAALSWLEKAVDTHSPLVALALAAEPLYDPLRSDPRFQALVRRTGIQR